MQFYLHHGIHKSHRLLTADFREPIQYKNIGNPKGNVTMYLRPSLELGTRASSSLKTSSPFDFSSVSPRNPWATAQS